MEIRQINFDVSRGGVQHRLYVCVGDTLSRTVVARFRSGSDPVPVTAAYIRAIRSDGVQIYAECAVEDGAVTYTFTTTDLSCGGELMCEFDLHNGESVMTSPRFAVVCADKLYSGDGIEGSNEYAAYIAALMKLENLSADAVSGEDASAEATVTDSAVQLHFVLPKGDKGDPGEASVTAENIKSALGYTPASRQDAANALRGSASGTAVVLDDVSPVEHTLDVKVRSKNLIPYPYPNPATTINGITFTDNGDGTITANGTATADAIYSPYSVSKYFSIISGDQYTLSDLTLDQNSTLKQYYVQFKYVDDDGNIAYLVGSNNTYTFTATSENIRFNVVIKSGQTVENLIFKPQLELGDTATDYTPYVPDLNAVKVKRYGKNLFDADTVLPALTNSDFPDFHWKKQEDGSFYLINIGTLASCVWFENTIGYNNEFAFSITLKTESSDTTLLGLSLKFEYTDGSVDTLRTTHTADYKTFVFTTDSSKQLSKIYQTYNVNSKTWIKDIMICYGGSTEYEHYITPTEYIPNADGTVYGVTSLYPTTTLMTDTSGAVIDAEYNRDINKLSTGGSGGTSVTADSIKSALGYTPANASVVAQNTSARHTHSNKTVLDGITAEKVSQWDNSASATSAPFIVTVSSSGSVLSADKTYAEIVQAIESGKNVLMYNSDNSSYFPVMTYNADLIVFGMICDQADYVYPYAVAIYSNNSVSDISIDVYQAFDYYSCLIEGTPIDMADGTTKAIEEVQTGDLVQSYNPEAGEITPAVVISSYVTGYSRKFNVYSFEDGHHLTVYGMHGFYNKRTGETKDIRDIDKNDILVTLSGEETKLITSRELLFHGEKKRRYNLVTSNNLYFANGILLGQKPFSKMQFVLDNKVSLPDEIRAAWQADVDEYNSYSSFLNDPAYHAEIASAYASLSNAVNNIKVNKKRLADSDYWVQKFTEGLLSLTEWADAKTKRAAWRKEINDNEALRDESKATVDAIIAKYRGGKTPKSIFEACCTRDNALFDTVKAYFAGGEDA